jgi:hypothetical protein
VEKANSSEEANRLEKTNRLKGISSSTNTKTRLKQLFLGRW